MKKLLLTTLFAVGLGIGVSQAAEIVVRIGPPRAIVERRPVRPARDYVWIGGYHTWNGNAYVWVPGRWEAPPRPHARWVAPRWQHRRDGYVYIEGRWR